MPRYVTRAVRRMAAECDGWDVGRLYDSIDVPDSVPADTGLLDHDGNTIWRVNDPIGFAW